MKKNNGLGSPGVETRPMIGGPSHVEQWLARVIPRPKQCQVVGAAFLKPEEIGVEVPQEPHPLFARAAEKLAAFAKGESSSPFVIRLVLSADHSEAMAAPLATVPNHEQAYVIRPVREGRETTGLELVGETPLALLYAAITLSQSVRHSPGTADARVMLPFVAILDWPDLSERGLWGGDAASDLEWMADRKMNVVELHARLSLTEHGEPQAQTDPDVMAEAARVGVKIVPVIMHLDQLPIKGLFERYPELKATPDPRQPLPTDYEPQICFSQPRAIALIAGWMRQLLALADVTDIMVWLSEMAAPCYCERCQARQPFVIETEAAVAAFREASAELDDVSLRLLLTQATYEVNDQILAATPPDVKVSYYHGRLTYDSSHEPMIYPLIEDFSRSGRWTGVYPQLTNSWRTVFPFTGPQFVRARMNEFVDKQIDSLIGYATPSNRYYEFNLTAAAEWGWSSGGRSPAEFSEAFAEREGYKDPKAFAQWADLIGPVGWNLAGSRVIESLIWDPGRTLSAAESSKDNGGSAALEHLEFGKGLLKEFPDERSFGSALEAAEEALELAKKVGQSAVIAESCAVLSAVRMLEVLRKLPGTRSTRDLLERLIVVDQHASSLVRALDAWGRCVAPKPVPELPSRYRDTVETPARVADAAWRYAGDRGISDPAPVYRSRSVHEWSAEDFREGGPTTIKAEITELLPDAGEYVVTLTFLDGAHGLSASRAAILKGSEDGPVVAEASWGAHVGRWCGWTEYWLPLREHDPDERYFLQIDAESYPPDAPAERRTTHGRISLRKSWRNLPSE